LGSVNPLIGHAGARRHPSSLVLQGQQNWIPAYAGMAKLVQNSTLLNY
jgi:hypothetical protein